MSEVSSINNMHIVNFVTLSGTFSYIIATCVDKAAKYTVNVANLGMHLYMIVYPDCIVHHNIM